MIFNCFFVYNKWFLIAIYPFVKNFYEPPKRLFPLIKMIKKKILYIDDVYSINFTT